jgi:hypothetical protein
MHAADLIPCKYLLRMKVCKVGQNLPWLIRYDGSLPILELCRVWLNYSSGLEPQSTYTIFHYFLRHQEQAVKVVSQVPKTIR